MEKCMRCGHEIIIGGNFMLSEINGEEGLLCSKCNSLLGMANDDIEILKKAIEYLKDKKTSFFDSINI